MKKSEVILKTKVGIGPVIFTFAGLISSITVITLIAIFAPTHPFGVVAMIFFGIIGISAIALMFGIFLDYAYIKNDTLYMQFILKSSKIKLKDIGDMILKDNVYTVFDKSHNKIGTINAFAIGADRIVVALSKAGANIK